MKRKVLLVGTGFQGICDAAQLVGLPEIELHMIDAAPHFGGILRSFQLNGFFVDRGLHLFSGTDTKMLAFLEEVLQGRLNFISSTPSSGFSGVTTENYDLPDLSNLDKKIRSKILTELLSLSDTNIENASNLSQYLRNRYGLTAGKIFREIFQALYKINPDNLEANEISKTSLVRLKFGDDSQMMKLKLNPHLDSILAARRPLKSAAKEVSSYYPSGGKGMLEFALAAERWLSGFGVKIHLNQSVNTLQYSDNKWSAELSGSKHLFDQVIWSNGSVQQLAKILGIGESDNELSTSAATIFAIYGVRKADICFNPYVQIFDPDEIVSRVGAAGVFGNQITEKDETFITCECPVAVSDIFWTNAEEYVEKIWNCLERYSLVSPGAHPQWSKIVKVPKTLTFHKVGSTELNLKLADMLSTKYKSLYFRVNPLNSRRDIFRASFDTLEFAGQ
ncbi:FAD-dependent oxidoreductase [Alphaproteobacteria bacterium]|nr:FAD-dependent oxidoreductase [Alphaproteobacteria bacterium]